MPLIEFLCPKCSLAWNHRAPTLSPEHDQQKCKRCGTSTNRKGLPSSLSIQRAGTSSATIDHVVGANAAELWDEVHGKKEVRDIKRKELGTQALTQLPDGSYAPATPDKIAERKAAYKAVLPSEG